jgi:acyl-coenzyme A synthetase/AMP-(fatty) acid ligase
VLDPTWPQQFLAMAAEQVEAAALSGLVGSGDMVLFSSGSTGKPRGIVRTVASWRPSVATLSDLTGITEKDHVWVPGPLWSSLFLYGAFHAGAVGARMTFRDDDRDESASATALHCVPSQLPGLLDRAEAGGLPLVRVVVVAGDHLPAPVRQRCERAGWRVVEYYGAAELSFVAWRDRHGPFVEFPGVETELRDGILWARSPYLARGYLAAASVPVIPSTPSLGLQDSTRTVPRFDTRITAPSLGLQGGGPFRIDSQGWATVGDMGRVSAGGLVVLGRGNLAVTTGGHTVVVEEVERLLRLVPGVQEIAVLGMPHPRLGQVLAAVVVGPAVDATLRAAVAGMPAPSRPRRWLHADALPMTSGGKLRRDALPELVAELSQS